MLKAAAPTRSHTAVRAGGGVRTHAKGEQTRAEIVAVALAMAARVGLEGLSIGTLADAVGKSKSGVFAHFGSREDLQIAVVREYYRRFETEVFAPAMRKPRGLPRVRALFENWMRHTSAELQSGCIFISGAVEFDDRPGPVRDALAEAVDAWIGAMTRAVAQACEEKHLAAGADPGQISFEIHALILALHYEARFMRRTGSMARARQGFANIIQRYGAPPSTP
ncbi:TetR/AcrR family transcriptional regulator [Ottowia sp.]|uniref:TetR/AcrR family transcriptional regulator n=1 Tax=Ottowia sp. TaxID=1898956 RepID=UPI00395C5B89|nr:TetR/AcrR family transcriptional regulator [Pseudomonadota bacterium]